MDKQLQALAETVNSEYEAAPTSGQVELDGRAVPTSECSFHEIPGTDSPGLLACIDGGNVTMVDTPFFAAGINRLFCSICRGKQIRQDCGVPAFTFLSMIRNIGGGAPRFAFFPYQNRPGLLPDGRLIEMAAGEMRGPANRQRLHSLPRTLGEWLMAGEAARTLRPGDHIILDGSLSVWGDACRGLARSVLEEARRNGVMVCGLSKTTELRVEGGRPLLDWVQGRYGAGATAPWYVEIGHPPADPRAGDYHTVVVNLHPDSRWAYRLDIDAVMLKSTGREGMESVLASLAANASHSYMPGYPYGMIRADRFARVRRDEARMAGARLMAMLDGGLRRSITLNAQHDRLNRVVGG